MLEPYEILAILLNVAWVLFLASLWWWDNLPHLK